MFILICLNFENCNVQDLDYTFHNRSQITEMQSLCPKILKQLHGWSLSHLSPVFVMQFVLDLQSLL